MSEVVVSERPRGGWVLADFGEVISTPLSEDAVAILVGLSGLPRKTLLDRYWAYRVPYDLGQSPADYWSVVLDRDLADEPGLVDRLTRADVHGWMGLNSRTLRTLLAHTRRAGTGLALLSNAPEALAAAIEGSYWSRHFTHRFYSCRLGLAKPDEQVFRTVLDELGASAQDVFFVDDRAVNTLAARGLGMQVCTFTSAAALDRELRLSATSSHRPGRSWSPS